MSLLNVESYVFINVFYLVLVCIHVCVDDSIERKIAVTLVGGQKGVNLMFCGCSVGITCQGCSFFFLISCKVNFSILICGHAQNINSLIVAIS